MNNPRLRSLLTGLVLLAVVALTGYFGILPQVTMFNERISQAVEVDAQTSIELVRLQQLQDLEKIQPAIEAQLASLKNAIPSEVEISKYVDILDILAARNNVEIQSLTISDAIPYLPPEHIATDETIAPAIEQLGGALGGIPIAFVVSGSYGNLVSFMGEIQASPRTTVIQSATLTSLGISSSYSLNLTTLIFAVAEPVTE